MKIMLIDDEVTIENASIDDILNFAMNLISDGIGLCGHDILRNQTAVQVLKTVPKAIADGYKRNEEREDE